MNFINLVVATLIFLGMLLTTFAIKIYVSFERRDIVRRLDSSIDKSCDTVNLKNILRDKFLALEPPLADSNALINIELYYFLHHTSLYNSNRAIELS